MNPRDVASVLDLCDEVLASSSLRGHHVMDVPVDAFWPAVGIAVIVTEGRVSRGARERLRSLDDAGIKAVTVSVRLAQAGTNAALRRLREVFDEEPAAPVDQPVEDSRARPMLLAILGAAALTRRAARAGEVLALEPGDLEALGVIAAQGPNPADEPAQIEALAQALAVAPADMVDSLAGLEEQGLVCLVASDHSEGRSWRLTDTGRAAVATWLSRCDGLLAAWPPPPPRDVDDVR